MSSHIGHMGKVVSSGALYLKKMNDLTRVYVAKHLAAMRLVTGRATVGMKKRFLYQRALVATLSSWWRDVAEQEGVPSGGLPMIALLRGGRYIRPSNLESIMGHPVPDVGLKIQRFKDVAGKWHAKVDVEASYGLEKLKGATVVALLDECGASGSTPETAIDWLRVYVPTLEKVFIICPLFGDIALKRVMSTKFPVVVFSFGIFKVLPIGWKQTETDIVVPRGDDESGFLAIPELVWQGCKEVYGFGENGCTGCVAGDASRTMSEDTNHLITDLSETGEWWCVRNGTLPPPELWSGLTGLVEGVPAFVDESKCAVLSEMLALLRDTNGRSDRSVCLARFRRIQQLWEVVQSSRAL